MLVFRGGVYRHAIYVFEDLVETGKPIFFSKNMPRFIW